MRGSFKLGTVAGIKVFVHWTFAILIAYLVYSSYRRGHDLVQTMWSVLFVFAVFGTVFLHELGHALMAARFNLKTRDIILLPIGGVARMQDLPEKPSEELKVALAGPAVNVVLAILTGLVIGIPSSSGLGKALEQGIGPETFGLNFFLVNIWLAVFNLIPAFPMDGGRVLRALLSMSLERHVATRIAARIGQMLAVGFVFAGFFLNPFLVFIGLFIFLGAQAEAEMVQAQTFLKGFKVRDAVMRDVPKLQAGDTLGKAIEQLLNTQNRNFLVVENGEAVGTLNRDLVVAALAAGDKDVPLRNVMTASLLRIDIGASLDTAYRSFRTAKTPLLLVEENGKTAGIIDAENIAEFIMLRAAPAR